MDFGREDRRKKRMGGNNETPRGRDPHSRVEGISTLHLCSEGMGRKRRFVTSPKLSEQKQSGKKEVTGSRPPRTHPPARVWSERPVPAETSRRMYFAPRVILVTSHSAAQNATTPDPARIRLESPPPRRVCNVYASVDPARFLRCALIISCERKATTPAPLYAQTFTRPHRRVPVTFLPAQRPALHIDHTDRSTSARARPCSTRHAPLRTHTSPFSGKAPIRVSTHTLTGIRAAHAPNAGNPGKTLDQRTKAPLSVAGQPDGTRVDTRGICVGVITEEEEDDEGEGRKAGGVIRARQEEGGWGVRNKNSRCCEAGSTAHTDVALGREISTHPRQELGEDPSNQCSPAYPLPHTPAGAPVRRYIQRKEKTGAYWASNLTHSRLYRSEERREGRGREGRRREAARTQHAAREKGVLETTRRCVSKMITERSEGRKGRRAGARKARPGRREGGEARENWREYERAPHFTSANARAGWEKPRERS
ncbi:hypothetical protein B0H13DRAFT_1917061 [Mycena leptocephala]|nr:hypothetical protein B0H13DRAFT_1917061 [Mycena leptocephala]